MGGVVSQPIVELTCNGQMCAPGQVCCFENGIGQIQCSNPGTCSAGQQIIACDGPEDCQAGEYCCSVWTQNAVMDYIGCALECSGPNDYIVCHDNANCPSNNCATSGWIGAPYGYCP